MFYSHRFPMGVVFAVELHLGAATSISGRRTMHRTAECESFWRAILWLLPVSGRTAGGSPAPPVNVNEPMGKPQGNHRKMVFFYSLLWCFNMFQWDFTQTSRDLMVIFQCYLGFVWDVIGRSVVIF